MTAAEDLPTLTRLVPGAAAIALRFVHTADLHLDSPLRSLALRDPDLAALIGTATRAALERIVALCLEEEAAALLIAGDLYDGDQGSMKTAAALAGAFARLGAAGVQVCVLRGNHDAAARITGALELPENVHVFGVRPATKVIEAAGVTLAVHGVSFARGVPDHPLARFPQPVPGAVNVGMLHTSLGGAAGHDPYAPVSPAELAALGYDYWALGHIHARSVLPGPPLIVMPGMPQGRDIGEAGPKSATLVSVAASGRMTAEARPTALAEFARAEVSLAGAEGWGAVEAGLAAALTAAQAGAEAAHVVLRLRLTGATPLAWRLRRDLDAVTETAAALAAELRARHAAGVWVETVETACTPPEATGDGGALAELARLVADRPPPAAEAEALVAEVLRALPPELRARWPAEPGALAEATAALLREGVEDVLARLHAAGGGED